MVRSAGGPSGRAAVSARSYSERLGRIADRQLQSALDRFGLGRLVAAEPIPHGHFGQNLFLTSSTGEYVLRGDPNHPGQFEAERFYAEVLHQGTRVPVPWPYRIDPSTDIFGWSYAIMPRMPGVRPSDVGEESGPSARIAMARALGANLAEMHELTWAHPGRYYPATGTVGPLEPRTRPSGPSPTPFRCTPPRVPTTDGWRNVSAPGSRPPSATTRPPPPRPTSPGPETASRNARPRWPSRSSPAWSWRTTRKGTWSSAATRAGGPSAASSTSPSPTSATPSPTWRERSAPTWTRTPDPPASSCARTWPRGPRGRASRNAPSRTSCSTARSCGSSSSAAACAGGPSRGRSRRGRTATCPSSRPCSPAAANAPSAHRSEGRTARAAGYGLGVGQGCSPAAFGAVSSTFVDASAVLLRTEPRGGAVPPPVQALRWPR
ncbi:phosphotransferase [Actinomadura sp. J1-007]|nr:phosphotransferase [Actinomadura sp. J1-007]